MRKILQILSVYKKRIFLFIFFYLAFLLWFFPFGDLSVFVTTQVAKQTNNQVYLKFDDMNLSLLPTPGFSFSNVQVRTLQFPQVQCESLKIAPSILGLLAFNPGVSIDASGIMGGNVSVTTRGMGKTKNGVIRQDISLTADSLDLQKLSTELNLPMNLEGKLSMQTNSEIDPSFGDQPQGDMNLNAVRVNITSASIPTPIGPLALPDTKLQEMIVKGQINNGELNLEKVQLGTPQDELFAQVKGTMDVKFQTFGSQVTAVPGNFDLVVQIKTKPSYQSKAGLFLGFLDSYKKSESAQGTEYLFRISGNNFYAPPHMAPANTF